MNGEWSEWEDWGTCSNTCGNGTRYRTRRCDDPEPTNGGMECVGAQLETEICNEEVCPGTELGSEVPYRIDSDINPP